jgi:hypothetical protein
LKYEKTEAGLDGSTQESYNVTYEILSVNYSNIFYKETDYKYNLSQVYFYNVSKDFSNSRNPYGYDSSLDYYNLDKETLDTKLGAITTDHISWESRDAAGYKDDDWRHDGILIKQLYTTRWFGSITTVLIETNMPQLILLNKAH